MFIIVLDAGHGYGRAHNRGGLCYNEGDNNYYYSLILHRELSRLPGVKVILTRRTITDNPSLDTRGRLGKGADLLISLHSDAFSDSKVSGTTILDSVRHPNKELATKLVKVISALFNNNNRGVKYREGRPGWDWFGILRNSKAKSSMIIEHGFHTNMSDCVYFKNHHQEIASATANVIMEHYGLGAPKRNPGFPNSPVIREPIIKIDGLWGKGTTKALQRALGTTVDGVISGQYSNSTTKMIYSVDFKTNTGSSTVAALQKKIGASVDRYIGPETIRALQKYLGTPVDGKLSKPSMVVKEMQKRLNSGTF